MDISYYPGCSLKGTAKEYDDSIQAVCGLLDINLRELEDWNCCGASSGHFISDNLAIHLAARVLRIADEKGLDLLVPCAACFNRLKFAEKELKSDAEAWIDKPYKGEFRVLHINDLFAEREMLERLKQNTKNPLTHLRAVPYYGCLTVRPPKVTGYYDYEAPKNMDVILDAIGVDLKDWSYKTDCCGGSLSLTRPDIIKRLIKNLFDGALEADANAIVVDCPMCQANLDTRQMEASQEFGMEYNLPVIYISELMALAMGYKDCSKWWRRHFVHPSVLFEENVSDTALTGT